MKISSSRKQLTAIITFLLLVVISTCAYLIQEGFWANIHSQGMMRLAKENWDNREYSSSIYWYRAAYSTALEGGLRWEVFKIYTYRIGKFREQGNLSDALNACWQATNIWNQEGATSFMCVTIEDEIAKQK